MSGPDAPTETDSDRNGFLSYAAEWHSLAHGVYRGLADSLTSVEPAPDNRDVKKEPHYYRGGYVIGTLMQACLAVGVAYGLVSLA